MSEITVEDLRKAASCIYIAVEESIASDISAKLKWAADRIEALEMSYSDLDIEYRDLEDELDNAERQIDNAERQIENLIEDQ